MKNITTTWSTQEIVVGLRKGEWRPSTGTRLAPPSKYLIEITTQTVSSTWLVAFPTTKPVTDTSMQRDIHKAKLTTGTTIKKVGRPLGTFRWTNELLQLR